MTSIFSTQLITPGPRQVCQTRCYRADHCVQAIGHGKRAGRFSSNATRSCRLTLISQAVSRATVCRSAAVDAAEAEGIYIVGEEVFVGEQVALKGVIRCAADLMELELKVEGMVCDSCTTRVADALKVLTS